MRNPSFLDALPLVLGLLLGLFFLAGCGGDDASDAYGNFEAAEVVVSAEATGRLVQFRAREGNRLAEGVIVGIVDTTRLVAERDGLLAQRRNLQSRRQALLAQRSAALAQTDEAEAAAEALAVQLETAEEELARTRRLFDDEAATARALNEREGTVRTLRAQLQQARARAASVRAQADVPDAEARAIDDQVGSTEAQLRQVESRLADAAVKNPVAGTVLTVVAEAGETVQTGTPLYTVADLDTLTLRAYATGDQLPRLRMGMMVDVLVDGEGGALRTLPGQVVWIADQAQFTPTPIQTRNERAELVYAFDVRVPNPEGLLKVGMPGEVRFPAASPNMAAEATP